MQCHFQAGGYRQKGLTNVHYQDGGKQQNKHNATRVMIIGAGDAGNSIIKEIVTSNFSTMTVACIIDDDKTKWGSFIQA